MIDVLIGGKLYEQPQRRADKNGKTFATAKVTAAGGDGESLFVNCIAFNDAAVAALLALDAGDSIALSGSATPKAWTDREGHPRPALDVAVHQVLTAYHVSKKRRAMQRQQDAAHGGEF